MLVVREVSDHFLDLNSSEVVTYITSQNKISMASPVTVPAPPHRELEGVSLYLMQGCIDRMELRLLRGFILLSAIPLGRDMLPCRRLRVHRNSGCIIEVGEQ